MARQKKTTKRLKPQYVKSKHKGNSSVLTRRSITISLLLVILTTLIFGITKGVGAIHSKLFSKNPRFEIQHLEISCDGRLTEERIREYTGLSEGMNLFEMSFGQIEKSLSAVSMVESVQLERRLPHTLVVKVKERLPVARISGRHTPRPFVVDRFGVILPPRQSSASLPLIKGLDIDLRLGHPTNHPDVKNTLKIIALCDSIGYLRTYVQIESLDVKYSDFIYMQLKGGIRVKMPRFSLKPKLQNLATVIKIANGQGRRVKEVDLTLDSTKVKIPVSYY